MPARSPTTAALGLAISDLRIKRGWTQAELGDRCDTHEKYVGAVERGEKDVGWQKLVRFARALQIEPHELAQHASRFGPLD